MNINKKVGAGFLSLIYSSVTQAVCQLIILAVTSRYLDAAALGSGALALLIVGLFRNGMTVLVGHSIIQKKQIDINEKKSAITFSVSLGFVIFIALIVFSRKISNLFSLNVDFLFYILLGLTLFFELTVIPFESFYYRDLNFKKISKINSISIIFGLMGVTISGVYLDFSELSIVAGLLAYAGLKFIFLIAPVGVEGSYKFNYLNFKNLLNFGGRNALLETLSYMTLTLDQLIVGKVFGANQLGVYSRASQLINYPINFFGMGSDKVLFASISRVKELGEDIGGIYKNFYIVMSSVSFFVFLSIYLSAENIVFFVFGSGWSSSVEVLKCLSMMIFLRLTYKTNDSVMRALGVLSVRLRLQLVFFFLVSILCWIGSTFDQNGVARGLVVSASIYYVISTVSVSRILKVSIFELSKSVFRSLWVLLGLFILISFLKYGVGGTNYSESSKRYILLALDCSFVFSVLLSFKGREFLYGRDFSNGIKNFFGKN